MIQTRERNLKVFVSAELRVAYLIMWFIEKDLDCITNVQFIVQYVPQPHESAHRM